MPLTNVYFNWEDLKKLQEAAERDKQTPKEWIKNALMEVITSGKRISPKE